MWPHGDVESYTLRSEISSGGFWSPFLAEGDLRAWFKAYTLIGLPDCSSTTSTSSCTHLRGRWKRMPAGRGVVSEYGRRVRESYERGWKPWTPMESMDKNRGVVSEKT